MRQEYNKEYREINKERLKERSKEYYQKNKEKIKARSSKNYRLKNRKAIDDNNRKKLLLQDNKKQCTLCLRVLDTSCFFKKVSPSSKKTIQTSRCKTCFIRLGAELRNKNKIKYNATIRKRHASKIGTDLDKWRHDVNYIKLANLMRKRIWGLLNTKNPRPETLDTLKYIGCPLHHFKKHMYSTLGDIDATLQDYTSGKLHVDHIIPFDYYIKKEGGLTEDNLYKVMNYKNIRFLWAKDNLSKGNKY